MGCDPPRLVMEKAPIGMTNQSQKLVNFNAGVYREGPSMEGFESCLLPLQNGGKKYSQRASPESAALLTDWEALKDGVIQSGSESTKRNGPLSAGSSVPLVFCWTAVRGWWRASCCRGLPARGEQVG